MKLFKNRSGILQSKSVNKQIFLLMICTVTLPLAVMSGIVYYFSLQTVKTEYEGSAQLILNNLSFNIDQYLQSIEKGTLTAQLDSQLQNSLVNWASNRSSGGSMEDVGIQYRSVIEQFVSRIEMTIKNVDSVQIYAGDRVFYSVNFTLSDYDASNFTDEEWYRQTLLAQGKIVLFGTHRPFHRVNSKESVISIARVINKTGSKQPLAVILVDIRLDSLREILSLSESSNRSFLIVDDKGGVVYSSEGNEGELENADELAFLTNSSETGGFYTPLKGEQVYMNYVTSPYSGWKVIQYIDEREMTKDAEMLRMIMLGFAFCSLITALLFLFILSARVTKPIILLSRQVRAVGLGKFEVQLNSSRQDEFGVLYKGIRKMVEDLKEHIDRSATMMANQKVAQYGALKSQINPHFLANALESIQMKAIMSGQRNIAEMIGLLGRLFRIHIQTGKEKVTLLEELEHTRLYVKVQQMRFGDKIQYAEHLEPGIEQTEVLHFSLQPIIENAIVHGLERRSAPGQLTIAARLEGSHAVITVSDNGAGIPPEELVRLQERLSDGASALGEEHIGLKNVHERIRYCFGEQYGIEVQSEAGSGTTVEIRIPYSTAKAG